MNARRERLLGRDPLEQIGELRARWASSSAARPAAIKYSACGATRYNTTTGDCFGPGGVQTMRLNHLNLAVPDVARTREFLEKYFGLRCVFERGQGALAILVDESGFILALSNFDRATAVAYPTAFHVGFMQESRERVDQIYARLQGDGFEAEPPREFHGAWTFYFQAPGGVVIEVGHQHRA
jgi:catechol 2,3-dioxygenase-like lactoylglutathione lyase family enzyme